ncbi:hypothetical protein, partial [Streptomyces sp. NPDC004014]
AADTAAVTTVERSFISRSPVVQRDADPSADSWMNLPKDDMTGISKGRGFSSEQGILGAFYLN